MTFCVLLLQWEGLPLLLCVCVPPPPFSSQPPCSEPPICSPGAPCPKKGRELRRLPGRPWVECCCLAAANQKGQRNLCSSWKNRFLSPSHPPPSHPCSGFPWKELNHLQLRVSPERVTESRRLPPHLRALEMFCKRSDVSRTSTDSLCLFT